MKCQIPICIVIIFLFSHLLYGQTNKKDVLIQRIETLLNDQFSGFSGSVLVAKTNDFTINTSRGFTDNKHKIKINGNTSFGLASLGKLFTMLAISKLIEEGKLSMDDYLADYIQGFSDSLASKVTINHLLTHTSGWEHYWQHPAYLKKADSIQHINDLLPFLKTMPLDFEPGKKYQYSNVGYIFLGAIIERISNSSYQDYIDKEIFKRLKMENSSFAYNRELDASFAKPQLDSTFLHDVPVTMRGSSDGGAYASINDVEKLVQSVFIEESFLSSQYLDKLMGNFKGEQSEYFDIQGGFNGVNTSLVYHKSGFYIIVLSNQSPPIAENLTKDLVELVTSYELENKNQLILKGIVQCRKSKNPIAYTNIGIVNKAIGTASQINGVYHLDIPSKHINDILTFSALGYKTVQLPIRTLLLSQDEAIELEELPMNLNEIVIQGQKFMETIIGPKSISLLATGAYIGGRNPGAALVTTVSAPKYPAFIKEIKVHVRDNKKQKPFKLRLRILSKDENGRPKNDILLINKIVASEISKGWLTFDFKESPLEISNPVFVGVEWIEEQDVLLDKSSAYPRISYVPSKKSTTYARTTSLNQWKYLPLNLFINAKVEY